MQEDTTGGSSGLNSLESPRAGHARRPLRVTLGGLAALVVVIGAAIACVKWLHAKVDPVPRRYATSMLQATRVWPNPSFSAAPVAHVSGGQDVWVTCTATGPRITYAGVSTRVWDDIASSPLSSALGFVPDAWVDTGVSKRVARRCRRNR